MRGTGGAVDWIESRLRSGPPAEGGKMLKLLLQPGRRTLVLAFCVFCCDVTGCLESSFDLAGESRLPKWISVPPGLARGDVVVTMNYYTSPLGGSVEFVEKDKNGKILTKVSGKLEPYPLHLKNPPPGSDSGYPAFELITLDGTTEVIEHKKMEPKFYVNDDPAVRKELLAASGSE